jgi:hypothetical protein
MGNDLPTEPDTRFFISELIMPKLIGYILAAAYINRRYYQ